MFFTLAVGWPATVAAVTVVVKVTLPRATFRSKWWWDALIWLVSRARSKNLSQYCYRLMYVFCKPHSKEYNATGP